MKPKYFTCPHCGEEIKRKEIFAWWGAWVGTVKSEAKAVAARENGKLGGRPKKAREVIDEPTA